MKLVKNGNGLVLPVDNDILLELVITKAGIQLKSPLPPNEVCKILNNISTDLMYQSFQPVELPKIQPV